MPLINSSSKFLRLIGYGLYGIIGLFIFLIILGLLIGPGENNKSIDKNVSTKAEVTAISAPKVDAGVVTKETINDILRSHNGGYEYEVMSASNDYVLIKLLPKTAWDEEWMIKSSLIASEEIFRELFKNPKVERVAIMQMASFTDAYGKSDVSKAFTIEMKRATAEKINWDNFLWSNLFRLADSYEVVPSVKKGLSYSFMQEYGIN